MIFNSRWLMVPFYIGLALSLAVLLSSRDTTPKGPARRGSPDPDRASRDDRRLLPWLEQVLGIFILLDIFLTVLYARIGNSCDRIRVAEQT
jgi:hypothetical protein